MRKTLAIIMLTAVLTVGSVGIASAGNQVSVKVNDKQIHMDVPPVIKSGRTLVPVRAVSEALGADVSWNPVDKQVTIVKNDKTILLAINKRTVLINGIKVPDLDVPAVIVNGRTLVPIRFIGETTGGTVNWEQGTRTVSLTMTELRDQMTPEQLLVKSNEAMQNFNSYKFKGEGQIIVSNPDLGEDIKVLMSTNGGFRKAGVNTEVYQAETITFPAFDSDSTQTTTMEMYTVGQKVYTKTDGAAWESTELTTDPTKLLENQDPQQSIQMLKDYCLILSHGNMEKVEGKEYYTLVAKIDTAKLLQLIENTMKQSGASTDAISGLTKNMKLDMTEKIFIDKNTLLMTKTYVTSKLSLDVAGSIVNEDIAMNMDMFDFGGEIVMPTVPEVSTTLPEGYSVK